ncbi:hypothetical protein L6R52_40765, partial [Myxococcota bacterium]|nr:hypothetical protein [Myxococcota bacterium]
MPRIAVYVTGHGFGHATRTSALLAALFSRARAAGVDLHVELSSNLPAHIWAELEPWRAELVHRAHDDDFGMKQSDGVTLDLPATAAALERYLEDWDAAVAREAGHVAGFDLVLADIPAIPIEAAARAGVPALAIGNFDWSFIYRHYAAHDPIFTRAADRFACAYAHATELLRLPFATPMDVFPRAFDAPLLVRRPRRSGALVRAELGLASDPRPIVLVTFGGLSSGPFGLAGMDERAVAHVGDFVFLALGPATEGGANVVAVPRGRFYFPDLVAACDVIVTKLGYGIVSEAVAQRKRLVFPPRPEFPEYSAIADALDVPTRVVPLDVI